LAAVKGSAGFDWLRTPTGVHRAVHRLPRPDEHG
jgi:hypothetical protein